MREEASNLKKYIDKIKKKCCSHNCIFKNNGIENCAIIPPPLEISGIIISRDPTVQWRHKYEDIRNNHKEDNVIREKLFKTAIPHSLKEQIGYFMSEKISENEEKCLFNMLSRDVYWTHLQKCFTDASGKKSPKFNKKYANECYSVILLLESSGTVS